MPYYRRRYAYRRKPDALTGGTGDVSPNIFSLAPSKPQTAGGNQSGHTTTAFPSPTQRLSRGATAQVMEILKVFIDYNQNLDLGVVNSYMSLSISTTNKGTVAPVVAAGTPALMDDPDLICMDRVWATTAAGGSIQLGTRCIDLTDGNGHGVLCASDNIYVQVGMQYTNATNTTVSLKILYRWKNIGLGQYVGIVQSQQ